MKQRVRILLTSLITKSRALGKRRDNALWKIMPIGDIII